MQHHTHYVHLFPIFWFLNNPSIVSDFTHTQGTTPLNCYLICPKENKFILKDKVEINFGFSTIMVIHDMHIWTVVNVWMTNTLIPVIYPNITVIHHTSECAMNQRYCVPNYRGSLLKKNHNFSPHEMLYSFTKKQLC